MVSLLNDPWWKSSFWVMWWIYSRLGAPIMALALPILVVYGLLNPHPEDMRALKLGDHEVALLASEGTGGGDIPAQRLYLVIPRVFSDAGEYEVEERSGSLRVSEGRGEALLVLSIWAVCIYALGYFWIRPFRERRTNPHTSGAPLG